MKSGPKDGTRHPTIAGAHSNSIGVNHDAVGAGGAAGGNGPEPGIELVRRVLAACSPGRSFDPHVPLREQGLASLAATRLFLELRRRWGLSMSIGQVAEGLTLNDIAAALDSRAGEGGSPDAAPDAAASDGVAASPARPVRLLPLQQAYLVTSSPDFTADPAGCHIYREYEVYGASPEAIGAAWATLCREQPMLRANVTPGGSYGFGEAPPLQVERVADGSVDIALSEQRARWEARAGRSPDALVRAALIADSVRAVVVLSLDGLVIDGTGLAALLGRWSELIDDPGAAAGPLPDLSTYLEQLREAPSAADGAYWRSLMDEAAPPLFEAHAAEPATAESGAGPEVVPPLARRTLSCRLDPALWQACEVRAREWGISSTSVVFAAFCQALIEGSEVAATTVMMTTNGRSRLPAEAERLVASFTSSMIVPVVRSPAEDFPAFAMRQHRELWTHLEHAALPAVSVLRESGRADAAGFSSVVFTSLLDSGPCAPARFREIRAAAQTSGVAIEHQMEACGDSLLLRWFVADSRLPGFAADLAWERMLDLLRGIAASPRGAGTLNPLQQAYLVQRRSADVEPDSNAVFSAKLSGLTPERLAEAWRARVLGTAALRRRVEADGSVTDLELADSAVSSPVIDLGAGDLEAAARDLDAQLALRRFTLGSWPSHACVALRDDAGGWSVHFSFDLMFLDGASIHAIVADMLAALADPSSPIAAGAEPAEPTARAAEPPDPAYWTARAAALLPGVAALPAVDRRPDWRRVEARLGNARAFRARCLEAGRSPDMLVAAAFAYAGLVETQRPFTLPLIWWPEGSARPAGEASSMSWPTVDASGAGQARGASPAEDLQTIADMLEETLRRDLAAGGAEGLRFIARRIQQDRGADPAGRFALPVVYTQSVAWPDLPAEIAETVRWRTRTPGIAMDAVSMWMGDALVIGLDYDAAAFAPGQVERLHARFASLAEALLEAPLVAPGEPKARPGPGEPEQAHRRFERAAARAPDSTALLWKSGSWSYGELNRRANRIARMLGRKGVAEGCKVGIAMRRGADMVAAVLGVLKAGAAYVPIEPDQPLERAMRMIGIADVTLVLSTSATALAYGRDAPEIVTVDQLPEDPLETIDPPCAGDPDATAYIIFTSGSTGEPKGVEVTHRPVANLLDWCARTYGFGPQDRGLCVTSLGFDLSVFDLLGLLGYGASLYVADEVEQRDPLLLFAILVDRGITFWNSTPKVLEHLSEYFPRPDEGPAGTCLRLAFLSGDYMSVTFPPVFHAAFPGARLINLGGATEATVWSNYFEVGEVDPDWRSIPYGHPIDGARYYVLDEALLPCPPDVEGDLFIAGAVLSRGYYNRPDLTAERFLPDRLAGGGERMYATGDRALRLADGTIIFRGRRDGQVKIRGVRIEVEEVEHALRAHPDIADVAVLVETDASGEAKLVAHVASGAGVSPEAVLRFAGLKLPVAMCPARAHVHERLPVTSNGKLDRKRLAASPEPGPISEPPPAEELGREIGERLEALLGYAVDPDGDLWQQGVTSFTIIQLVGALRRSREAVIRVEWLLDAPSVNGIAAILARHLGGAAGAPVAATEAALPAATVAPAAEPVNLLDAEAKAAFLVSGANRCRNLDAAPRLPFGSTPLPAPWLTRRASKPGFGPGSVAADDLRHLFGHLAEQDVDGERRFLYPSAGATYAVQAFLWVRPGAVAGLDGGFYWFDPRAAELRPTSADARWDRTTQFVYNRPLFDQAAAAIFLVGESAGIEPLYGEQSMKFLTLEAGYMGQVLMLAQAGTRLGLCPIGSFREDEVRARLDLGPTQTILHSFLVGDHPDGHGESTLPPLFAPAAMPMARPMAGTVALRIVGHSLRYADCTTPAEFHRLLESGRSAVTSGSARAEIGSVAAPGAFLPDIESFDAAPFGIAPSEAALIDPQARLLLELAFHCLEDSGHTVASLQHGTERTGVFVGQMWQDYRLVGTENGAERGRSIGGAGSELANRISQVFGFTGPSVAVDTACTSSLVALHLACRALQAGDCSSALVCGVNLLAHPAHLATLQALGFVAERPLQGMYDASAAGWEVGEGAAVLLVRRSDAFEAEADRILAVIEGTHVEHAGARARYGSPNRETVTEGLLAVLGEAGLEPSDIDYVETAASGAPMADAAEWEAIRTVFPPGIRVGSVKPNVGHLEAASGMPQISKVLLQAEHGELLPTRVATTVSPLVETGGGAPAIVTALSPLPVGGRARFLISSAGSTSGAAQAILAAPEPARPTIAEKENFPSLLLVSAETPEQLAALVDEYRHALRSRPETEWRSICATSQHGRKAFPFRLAVEAAGPSEAADRLDRYACDGISGNGVTAAHSDTARAGIASAHGEWRGAAKDWVSGHDVDWRQFWRSAPRRCALPLYPFQRTLYRLSEPDNQDLLERVRQAFGEAAGIPAERLDPDRPLGDYGVSSRIAGGTAAELSRALGSTISPTLFYEYRDLRSVARHLATVGTAPQPRLPARQPVATSGGLAVIGYSGLFPGCGDSTALWRRLLEGADLVAETAPPPGDGPGRGLLKGSFLARSDVECFDPFLFGITPVVAARMDPQERLLLQQSWLALEDAGYPPRRLRDALQGRVGVYVGCMHNEYPLLGLDASSAEMRVDAGGTPAGLANRISYHLDVTGPSLTLDTMCSSSLTAVKLAADDLRASRIDLAIVGASNLSLHSNKYVQQQRLGMTSKAGRCRSFAADGDGFVPGEGVVVLVLRRHDAAIADGDPIHGIVRGVAINHGGKSNGYTVPNPDAQAAIIAAALEDAGVAADTISYVETHGTGTVIGDPIEAKGIIKALGLNERARPLPIGSVKSNLGHLEAAAGLASAVKVLEQLRHGLLAPSIHADRLNPDIDWNLLSLVRSPMSWEPADEGGTRIWRAGISSFGAGGSNAHMILERPEEPVAAPPSSRRPHVLPLSAATPASLTANAEGLLSWLAEGDGRLADIADVCATLQIGREPLAERWATVVEDTDQAIAALTSFCRNEPVGLRGRVPPGRESPADARDPAAAAAQWVAGAAVDWSLFHGGRTRILRLPGYRFERLRCWIDSAGGGVPVVEPKAKPAPGGGPAPILVERVLRPSGAGAATSLRASWTGRVAVIGEADGREAFAQRLARLLPRAQVAVADSVPGAADCLVVLSPVVAERAWTELWGQARERIAGPDSPAQLLYVRRNEASSGDDLLAAEAKLGGLLAALAVERAGVRFTDIQAAAGTAASPTEMSGAEQLADAIATGSSGELGATPFGPSAPRWEALAASADAWRPRPDRIYVVTGGTRGLGAALAARLVERGARHLGLIGRTASPGAEQLAAKLRAQGADIRLLYCPMEDRAGIDACLAALDSDPLAIGGIFHCAGVGTRRPGPLASRPMDEVEATLGPKVDGLLALCGQMRRRAPEFLVAFSSASAVLPQLGIGVGDYAAANAAMEQLGERLRRDHGLPVTTIAWPVWDSSTADAASRALLARYDLPLLSDDEGFALLWAALAQPSSGRLAVVSAKVLEQRLAPAAPVVAEAMPEVAPEDPPKTAPDAAAGDARRVEAMLTRIVADQIGASPEHVRGDVSFTELGIESMALARLSDALEQAFGQPLNPGLLLEHPTVESLARQLAPAVAAPPAAVAAPLQVDEARRDGAASAVAVIAMGVRFPGAADLAAFRTLVAEGRCAIGEVPESRWDVEALYHPEGGPGRSVSRWGGFVDDLELFDPDAFGISERVALHLDPAIRLLLEASSQCLRDAGLARGQLDPRTGVFVGARMGDYRLRAKTVDAEAGLGFDQNFIAAYLSHLLDIHGPNMVVDAACSSSLVAVHLACQSLILGETELAFAGGVDCLVDESVYIQFSKAGALSRSGRCRSFDKEANGFVPGEGAGMLLLKRLDRALRDGDPIHAVIEGSAVTNDGETMGLTTPNPAAHRAAILAALERSGRSADAIGLVEAHGTATRIGDPIEVQAFTQAFREQTDATGFCAIGSIKSNIGHLLSAAGIAGLAKAIVAVEAGIIPPTLFCDEPNPRLNLDSSPFYVACAPRQWPAGRDRVAGVSACGLGGTNVHVIVGQAPAHQPSRPRLEPEPMNKRRLWIDRVVSSPPSKQVAMSSILHLNFVD